MLSPHAILLLVVTVGVFYLYTRPWIRIELVSLLLLVTLLLIFYVFPYDGAGARLTEVEIFQSFGHPALIAICSLMILARGITMTGAMEPVVRQLARLWQVNRWLGFLCTLLFAMTASAVINDTPVLVLMLPLVLSLAERTHYPASKTLMPVNNAVLVGGMLTSIGTSTNVLVLSIATDLGMAPMGVFDFTGTVLIATAIAIPYLWLVAPQLLPDTGRGANRNLRLYEARVVVGMGHGKIRGRKLGELGKALGRPVPVFRLVRADEDVLIEQGTELVPGDGLLLRDTPEGLREFAAAFGVELFEREGTGGFTPDERSRTAMRLAELVVGNESDLNGRSLRDAAFTEKYQVAVVGINRGTGALQRGVEDIAGTPLAAGDVLLVQGLPERIDRLRGRSDLMLLDASLTVHQSRLAPIALAIMGTVLVLAALQILPIHVAAFLGVVAMLVTGCVGFEGVGRALNLEVVLLIASSVALGQALISTGAAAWVASGVAVAVDGLPPAAQIAAFMAFAAFLTNFVSNAATASVGTPIAIATAQQLGLPLEPFVLAILFGANLSYATPMAYQTNLIIMNAVGYRFTDFVRVGTPLVAIMLIALSVLLAMRYGL
jgi:di/tricarboxylate transporter